MARQKGNKKGSKANFSPRIANRQAMRDYHISEKLEVGIQLTGSEVKSIREGRATLGEGYARVDTRTEELFLHDVHIAQYNHAHGANSHEPTRTRKLLAHKREIRKLANLTSAKGHTLVPLAMYFVRGKVKLEVGVGTGKKHFDKREDVKKREHQRDMQRAMTRKVI